MNCQIHSVLRMQSVTFANLPFARPQQLVILNSVAKEYIKKYNIKNNQALAVMWHIETRRVPDEKSLY